MRWRIAVFGTLGALATGFGVLLVVAPDVVLIQPLGTIVEQFGTADPQTIMLGGTIVLGLYVVLAARSTGGTRTLDPVSPAERAFEATVTDPPEAVTDDRRQQTAARLDADIRTAIARGGGDLQQVRELLARTAASAYAHQENVSRQQARTAIEVGTWTGDDLAAAFLAGPEGPRPGVYSRIRLWLVPAAERERRIERTVDAIQATQEAPA